MTCSISDLSRSGESERAGGLAAQRPSDCRAERLLLVPLAQRLLVADSAIEQLLWAISACEVAGACYRSKKFH
jgi:hypothetical protein